MLELLKYLALAAGLLPEILRAVRAAEELVKAAQAGQAKKELVLGMVEATLDVADDFVKLDREKVLAIASRLIDLAVAALNLIGEFRHSAQPTNPTQATPAA